MHYGIKKNLSKDSFFLMEKKYMEVQRNTYLNDSFKKIIVVKDVIKPYQDEDGILTIGLFDFLQNSDSLEW
jgi:hypothetical protein